MKIEPEKQPIQQHDGRTMGLIALIIGIPVLLLSGLCTGVFLSETTFDGNDPYVPGVLGVLAIGAFGYIPAGLLVWAGLRLRRRGKNLISTLILIAFCAYLLAIGLMFMSTF